MTYPPPDLDMPRIDLYCPTMCFDSPGISQRLTGIAQRLTSKLEYVSESLNKYRSFIEVKEELQTIKFILTKNVPADLEYIESLLVRLSDERDFIVSYVSHPEQVQHADEQTTREAKLYVPKLNGFINDAAIELGSLHREAQILLDMVSC